MIARLALATGIPASLLKVIGIALAIGAAVLTWKLWLSNHDDAVIDTHETKIEAKLEKQGRIADEKLHDRKDGAQAQQQQDRKEFDNATAHLPKSGLTDLQRVDACNQLRRQGTDTSGIPPASAFKQEPAPKLDPAVVINDDEEGFRQYQQDKDEWGARGWQALGRVCLWFKDQGAQLECGS